MENDLDYLIKQHRNDRIKFNYIIALLQALQQKPTHLNYYLKEIENTNENLKEIAKEIYERINNIYY